MFHPVIISSSRRSLRLSSTSLSSSSCHLLRHLSFLSSSQQSSQFHSTVAVSAAFEIKALPLPALSPTMTHGSIATWHKKPGDALAPGDILCDVETDKASVGFEFQDDGVLAKILVEAKGEEIKIGLPIALVVNDEADYKAFLELSPSELENATPASPPAATPPAPSASTTPVAAPAAPTNRTPGTLSPAARHLVESKSLDVSSVIGSYKGGRIITKEDVLNGIKSGKAIPRSAPPAAPSAQASVPTPSTLSPSSAPSSTSSVASSIGGTFTDVPNNNMRKVIAKRLTESKLTVPHVYSSIECDITELLSLRSKFKKDAGVNVSVNDLVIKASALALRDVPECNGFWNPKTEQSEFNPTIDISVAVATPNGLITPIVPQVDTLGLSSISSKVKDLAGRARDGKLKPNEYQGGTFTISNLGMFGISSFTAVINPPQACILAVGSGIQRVVPNEKDANEIKLTTTMTVQLSSDRRVVDEATAGQFLQAFRAYLSNPTLLLL